MGMLDSLERGLDWLEKKQGVSDMPSVVEVKAGTGRCDRFQVIDAIDSETGEQTWIVANVNGSDRVICNSQELADRVAALLEGRKL